MSLPVVSAELWEDDEEPRPGGAQEKFWLKRPDGVRALLKLATPGQGPHHVNDLVGARLAQTWGLVAPDVQLFQHDVSGWGALVHELPRPYMDFKDLPMSPEILSGQDRLTLINDVNVRFMPIFDALINNSDRGGTHNSMVSYEESSSGPLRYRHWLTDHGYCFEGNLAPEQMEQSVNAAGGFDRYLDMGVPRLSAALDAVRPDWSAVEGLCDAVASFDADDLDALLAGIPGGLAAEIHLEGIRARILYNRGPIRDFVNGMRN